MPLAINAGKYGEITASEILEFVQGIDSMRSDKFSVDRADLDITYKVPGTKLIPFMFFMLGIDYVDTAYQSGTGNVYKLVRKPPAFHSVHNWAYCVSLQINGQQFNGDGTTIWADQITPSTWKQYQCVATFDMPHYKILADGAVSNEYSRYVSKELVPSVELVTLDHGALKYDANAGDSWNSQSVYTKQAIARRETAGIKLIWHRVPQDWIQQDDDSLPLKLLQIQGRVNEEVFLGRDIETLLCKEVRLKKYVSPLITNTFGSLYFMYDIEFDLIWNDPLPKGKTGETRHGWNFFPGGTDLQYFYATTTGGKKTFQTFPFIKAFSHWSDLWTTTP